MAWRVARSLDVLLEQLNTRFPGRSKASDGGIGDAAHAARVSDHNPDSGGVVRARDFTHDPAHGVDIDRFSDEIAASRDPRIKYCVTPETRVLCTDLHWRPIGEITVGQPLIAFDEYGPGRKTPGRKTPGRKTRVQACAGARMRTAYVEASELLRKPCYEIITDRGVVTASGDHMWLQAHAYQGIYRKWTKVADLVVGDEIQYFADPWEVQTSFDAGWLSGLFDGAGCLADLRSTWMLGVAQREGEVLDRAQEILRTLKISFSNDKKGPAHCLNIRGGRPELLRFLGTVPTTRLYRKAIHESQLWDNCRINGSWPVATVREVRPVGLRDVIAMQTSTRTFIAEGMFSHNCIANNLIMSGAAGPRPWQWRAYTGTNPHRNHMHLSVVADSRADDPRPWALPMLAPNPLENGMSSARQIADTILDIPIQREGPGQTGTTTLRAIMAWSDAAWSLGRQASEDAAARHAVPNAEQIRTIVREELLARDAPASTTEPGSPA